MNKKLAIWTVPLLTLVFSLLGSSCNLDFSSTDIPPQTASIEGRLYFDENMNDDCDICECGVSDIQVELHREVCSGELIQSIRSDEEGNFRFENLEEGTYCVFPNVDFSCEGFFPTTARTQQITVAVGENSELEPFGFQIYYQMHEDE